MGLVALTGSRQRAQCRPPVRHGIRHAPPIGDPVVSPLARALRAALPATLAFGATMSHAEESTDARFERLRLRAAAFARDPSDHASALEVADILRSLGGFYGAARL